MPAYYNVVVEEVTGTKLVLGVWIKHPEKQVFPEAKNFVLQLICDPIVQGDAPEAPLLKNASAEDLEDEDWLMDNEEELIDSVEIVLLERFPTIDLSSFTNEQRTAFWKDKNQIPYARYVIIVASQDTIAHLKPGMKWESAAYEV